MDSSIDSMSRRLLQTLSLSILKHFALDNPCVFEWAQFQRRKFVILGGRASFSIGFHDCKQSALS